MKNFIFLSLFLFCGSCFAAQPERACYYETFADGKDYSRVLRTAWAARGWEIIEKTPGGSGGILRVHFRFDEKYERALLIFDIPPVHMTRLQLRVRNPEETGAPVQFSVNITDVSGTGLVLTGVQLPADGKWSTYEVVADKQLKEIHRRGKVVAELLSPKDRDALAIDGLFFQISLPENSLVQNRDFDLEFELLECFAQ